MTDWVRVDNLLTGFLHMQYRKWGWKLFCADTQAKMGTNGCAYWMLILECLIVAIVESVDDGEDAKSNKILLGRWTLMEEIFL